MTTVSQLEDKLSRPEPDLIEAMSQLQGDIMILGAGGKMGPSLARLARRALDQADNPVKVMAASRFSNPEQYRQLQQAGIELYRTDLLDDQQLGQLPDAPNVLFLAGHKFGTMGNESLTWAMNAYLPGRVAEKYCQSKIIAFSTGNVYPFVSAEGGGATEETPPGPVGEYAQSCLGRERIFQYFSKKNNTKVLIFRLNYALDLRYGVLTDIALAVRDQKPIDLSMAYVNLIWQGDANSYALRSLLHCSSPAAILNVTGTETLSVKQLALELGRRMGKSPVFTGHPQPNALLNNASRAHRLLGPPKVGVTEMIDLTVKWLASGGARHHKPTHFQERGGDF